MRNFENSKVKEVCYHGTSSEPFTILDKAKIQKEPEDGDSGYFGWGFYLTNDKSYAEEYGDNVLSFKVSIENPFDFSNIPSKELVNFLFADCKNLELRVQETLVVINQIGREAVEFDTNNSTELLSACRKLYNNYRDAEVTSQCIKDVKEVLIQLSSDVNNWLNGLFFYFGRELFHYFTSHGYDGVIALGGKEIVVYETEQLKPVTNTNEELDLDLTDKLYDKKYLCYDDVRDPEEVIVDFVDCDTIPSVDENDIYSSWVLGGVKDGKLCSLSPVSEDNQYNTFEHFVDAYTAFINYPVKDLSKIVLLLNWNCPNEGWDKDFMILCKDGENDKHKTEDLELDVFETPDWESGADAYTKKIIDSLKARPEVSNIKLYGTKFYPERMCSVWYADSPLLEFTYKDILEVYFYCGGEVWIYRSDDDEDPIRCPSDFEAKGIYTDRQYYDFCNEYDIWGNGLADDTTAYFGFCLTPLKNNDRREKYCAYDMGYDDYYELDQIFDTTSDPLAWMFDECIPDFMREYPEFFEEEPSDGETEIKEEVKKEKKHVTKGQVLNDVINTFGCISANNLTDAVYLLPNGKILDTKGTASKSQHENVAKYISDKYGVKDLDENQGSKLMLELGCMRITPWIPAIFISDYPLSNKQENTLYDIVSSLASKVNEESPLMISSPDGKQQIEFAKIDNPEEIINSILGYQIFGILKA